MNLQVCVVHLDRLVCELTGRHNAALHKSIDQIAGIMRDIAAQRLSFDNLFAGGPEYPKGWVA